jgi:hypothetical protein
MVCHECPRLLSEYATLVTLYRDAVTALVQRLKYADADEFDRLTSEMNGARNASDSAHMALERHKSGHALVN